MPQNANEAYLDASLRHQLGLRMYGTGLVRRIQELLAQADAELTAKLRIRLAKFEGKDIDYTGERWKALLAEVREARAAAFQTVKDLVRPELNNLSVDEGAREVSQLNAAVPFEYSFVSVAAPQLRAIVSSRPFQGKLLNDWFKELEVQDRARLIQALQLGMVQGETTDSIVRRVIGTSANKYADGILSISRRDASTIVRTAVNHVSNTARNYVWDENDDVITARIWHSTLDGRTSAVCRARDGMGAPVGDNPLPAWIRPLKPPTLRPPAHMNCRSVMVAFIDGNALLGDRPFVTDTRTRDAREVDFAQVAREGNITVKQARSNWADENIGRVPASTTYSEFLSRQSAEFQDSVLGRTKGRLFRTGEISLDGYVDRAGNELTLSQLAATQPQAFRAVKLDPGAFAG